MKFWKKLRKKLLNLLNPKSDVSVTFKPDVTWNKRILRRAKQQGCESRSIDCSADDKPEEPRAQEAPAIVEQNPRGGFCLEVFSFAKFF